MRGQVEVAGSGLTFKLSKIAGIKMCQAYNRVGHCELSRVNVRIVDPDAVAV